jgi:hypothetical protein
MHISLFICSSCLPYMWTLTAHTVVLFPACDRIYHTQSDIFGHMQGIFGHIPCISGHIWPYLVKVGHIWPYLVIFGQSWSYLVIFGTIPCVWRNILHTWPMNDVISNKIHPHVTNHIIPNTRDYSQQATDDVTSNENILHMCSTISYPIAIFSTSYHLHYYHDEYSLRVTIEITSNKNILHTWLMTSHATKSCCTRAQWQVWSAKMSWSVSANRTLRCVILSIVPA